MTIREQCNPDTHQFEWHSERAGMSGWVCKKCGEYKEQPEDLGSGG